MQTTINTSNGSTRGLPDRRVTAVDRGFTLIEMLVVIVILGIMASVTALSVSGLSTEAADTSCHADRQQLGISAEAYFAQTGAGQISETGTDHDRFERTLVEAGFLHSVSSNHDLDADGVISREVDSPC